MKKKLLIKLMQQDLEDLIAQDAGEAEDLRKENAAIRHQWELAEGRQSIDHRELEQTKVMLAHEKEMRKETEALYAELKILYNAGYSKDLLRQL